MVFQRVGIPLIIVGLVALILLVVVLFYRHWRRQERVEEEIRAFEQSDSLCYERNERTGWVCDRWAHHPGNHRQTINGETYDWPREGRTA